MQRVATSLAKRQGRISVSPFLPRLRFTSNSQINQEKGGEQLFLHVGPSGDFWTGPSIFAAKHLQPDYVKSVAIPANISGDLLLEALENDSGGTICHEIYDTGQLPNDLLHILSHGKQED